MTLPKLLTKIVTDAGFDDRPWHQLTGPILDRNKFIAGALMGYGCSLLKACGIPRDEVVAVVIESWAGMQGGAVLVKPSKS